MPRTVAGEPNADNLNALPLK
ncbi:MAG: hypothetical protein LUB58_04575 [Oscillospiraceae bacterium]|nr:hypothetical protein [Oscillospiraceae bacterium]